MRTPQRWILLTLTTVVLLGFVGAWMALSEPVYASLPSNFSQSAPPSETPEAGGGVSESQHAAHHPQASQSLSDTVILSATEPIASPAMDGMMGGMMDSMATMHDSMTQMHVSVAGGMREFLDKHIESMTPEMAADAGRIAGRMESMGAMMGDMSQMMEACMQGGMMDGMPGMPGMMHGDTQMPGNGPMAGMTGMDADLPFDALFIDSMIVHHQGAIEMAILASNEAEHDELVTMAEAIISAQEGEIEQMQAWRDEWYPDLPASQGMDMAMGDMEIADDSALPFDQRFLAAMISHHRGAIAMAEAALTKAEHDEIVALAEDIIAAQQDEISQMEWWLLEWYDVEAQAQPAGMQGGMMGMMHGMQGDMAAMMEQMPAEMVEHMAEMHAQMGVMMSIMEGMENGAMGSTMPMTGTMPMDRAMPMMGGNMGNMDSMMDGMQSMMDAMLAGDGEMMTPEMAAEMGRMLGRMEAMSGMMDMMGVMHGDMADCSMMPGVMEGDE